jgi:hypothetical protein
MKRRVFLALTTKDLSLLGFFWVAGHSLASVKKMILESPVFAADELSLFWDSGISSG